MSEKIIKSELLLQHTMHNTRKKNNTRKKDRTRKKDHFDDIEDDIEDFDFDDKRKKNLTSMV